ncbi:hypothetical protein D3C73_1642040 [compost metagenome]
MWNKYTIIVCFATISPSVMQKLNVKGRSQAVVELIKLGELKIAAVLQKVTRLSLLLSYGVRGGLLLRML